MSYSAHVDAADMKRCLGTVRDVIPKLKPDFLLLTDLSCLQSMDADCAEDVGAIMDLCVEGGMKTVVRVIPDPQKDIGFALISRFHHHPNVRTRTYENLAEAVQSFLS